MLLSGASEIDAERKQQDVTASKLQALQRGKMARKKVEEQQKTASRIQALQRGRQARKEAKQQQNSAQRIQAIQRGKAKRQERASRELATVMAAAESSLTTSNINVQPMFAAGSLACIDASNLGLEGLATLAEKFRHVQQLNVSGNKLSSLKALSQLHFLHTIDASGNRIANVLDFEVPHYSFDPTANSHVGSSLLHASLANNRIEFIDSMLSLRHPRLMTLNLDGNKLRSLKGLLVSGGKCLEEKVDTNVSQSGLIFLNTLSVRNNDLENLEGIAAAPNLRRLHADGNKRLSSLEALKDTPDLLEISLSGNAVKSLNGLEKCKRIQKVDVSDNNLTSINALQSFSKLEYLNDLVVIQGNELNVTNNPEPTPFQIRHSVIYRLPQLCKLDHVIVSSEDKVKARVSHGEDIEQRKQLWEKCIPEVPWINMTPPQPK